MFAVWRWYNGSVVKCWCCSLLCVDAGEIDIYLQNVHFSGFCTKIGYKTESNVMITKFENKCVFKIYLIVLRHIFDTTYKGKKQVEIYMWALHHELVLFLQSRNCFRYVPENDIEGGIVGWTTSKMIGQRSNLCQRHSPRTSFNSKTDWILY